VVDDGSTDNSLDVIKAFNEHVHCIHKKNAGLSAARNTGFKASRGDLIGVLDADDMYTADFLATLVSYLDENPGMDGVHCGYRFVDHNNQDLPQVEARGVPSDELYEALLDGNFLVPESMFLRRKVYESVGLFDESLRACEDWDVWLRAAKTHEIGHCGQVLTRHRILPGSMSTDPLRMIQNRLTVLGKHLGPEPSNAGDSQPHRAYGRAYLGSCIEYLQYGGEEKAYENFRAMANRCPSLLTEIDTFFQIGCGDQPKGSLGDFASLEAERSNEFALRLLERLFLDSLTTEEARTLSRKAYATAYASVGMIAYGTRAFGAARSNFSRAIAKNPVFVIDRRVMHFYVKSCLGPGIIDFMKTLRGRAAFTGRSATYPLPKS
jgi:hypothetical protein